MAPTLCRGLLRRQPWWWGGGGLKIHSPLLYSELASSWLPVVVSSRRLLDMSTQNVQQRDMSDMSQKLFFFGRHTMLIFSQRVIPLLFCHLLPFYKKKLKI